MDSVMNRCSGEFALTSSRTLNPPLYHMYLRKAPLAAFGLVMISFNRLSAQGAEETQIELSPFTVNAEADVGYAPSQSLLGGRINTELLRTPVDVSVLTQDFLSDIGITNYLDAVGFLTSAVIANPNIGSDFGNQIAYRGMPTGYQTRNYFRSTSPMDAYNIERLESARGPNALLFGSGVVGGLLNTNTKRAVLGKEITQMRVRVDTEGSGRVSVDVNRAINKKFALRLNAVADENRTWIDRDFRNRRSVDLTALAKLWRGAELRFEAEYGTVDNFYYSPNFYDQTSLWDRNYSTNGAVTSVPAGTGVSRVTSFTPVYSPRQRAGVYNLQNYVRTTGTGLSLVPVERSTFANFPSIARNNNIQPDNAAANQRDYLLAAFLEQQFTPSLIGEVAVQYANNARHQFNAIYQNYNVDINRLLPDGTVNPMFGKVYTDKTWRPIDQDNQSLDFRGALAWTLPFKKWKQRVNFFTSRTVSIYDGQTYGYGRNNNPSVAAITNAQNELQYRVYWGDHSPLVPPASDSTYTWEWVSTQDLRQTAVTNTGQVSTVISAWQDRISIVAGTRYDDASTKSRNTDTRDAAGRPLTNSTVEVKSSVQTSSAGFVFFPLPQVGAYANYSESFNPAPSGSPGLYGEVFGPTSASGKSAGLRFKLFGNSVVGSAGYYRIQEANRVSGNLSAGEINGLWDTLLMSNRRVGAGTGSYRDLSDYEGSGWESEITVNVGQTFKLRANFALPETSQQNSNPGLRRYLEENLATWQRELATGNPLITDPVTYQNRINTLLARVVSGNDGRTINLTPDYTASIFGMYTFRGMALKGLRVGAGSTWQGRKVIGNTLASAYDYIYSDGYYIMNATVGYNFMFGKHRVDLQLNVDNLLDNRDPVFMSAQTYSGRVYRHNVYYNQPRRVALSISYDL